MTARLITIFSFLSINPRLARFYDYLYDMARLTVAILSKHLSQETTEQDIASKLGVLKGTFHVKLSFAYFLPHAVLLIVALLGFAIWWSSNSGWQRYVTLFVFALLTTPVVFAVWKTLPRVFDKLCVYQNGFAYYRGRETLICRWDEIKDYDSIVDLGNRLKLTGVEKRSGEKITFAYKMRGLDLLDHEYSEYTYAKIPDSEKARPEDTAAEPTSLGKLQNTFHVKISPWNLWPMFLLSFPALMGVAAIFAIPEIAGKIVCSVPAFLPLLIYVWATFTGRRDEMNIFENGFSYRNKGVTTECLWKQIEDYDAAGTAFSKMPDSLVSIKKENGPWIPVAAEMQGKEYLQPHLQTLIKWKGVEE